MKQRKPGRRKGAQLGSECRTAMRRRMVLGHFKIQQCFNLKNIFVTLKGVTVVSRKAVWYSVHMVKITANSMDKRILVGYDPWGRRVRHD